ncbi:MAG TPA: prepilin-type N-terminal cleavage/methylation domain-containing protein [Tepidisphaeraceae bacterium]|nr:prepilin-type N-terminal cleavage/methylation domain-containing protein [Tepidisphaeraceae bacterium]
MGKYRVPRVEGHGRAARATIGRGTALSCRAGFTLTEMSISMVIVAIIVMAVGSSVNVLFRAAEGNRNLLVSGAQGAASSRAQAAAARTALDTFTADLKLATGLIDLPGSNGAFSLLLTVPGRYSGHTVESLTYKWSGPGTSFTRQLNTTTAVSIADNVQSLSLASLSTAVGPALPTGVVTWHDGGGGTNVTGFAVSSTTWPSQFLLPPPSLPMKTVSWSISHIKLQLQGTGSGTIIVQVYSASATQQPATLLDSASFAAGSLPTGTSPAWTDVTFTKLTTLGAAGVCLVVSTTASGTPASVYYDTGAAGANIGFSTTSNGGLVWSTITTPPALQFQVYGAVTLGS